jgi:GT2 family glycosyltransferase
MISRDFATHWLWHYNHERPNTGPRGVTRNIVMLTPQSMSPTVSICIPNYNGATYIHETLASVFSQIGSHAVEILVHDDASTDGSAELIRNAYPQITVLETTSNAGFCISCNRLVAAAQGEYILLLNNDAQLMEDALTTLLASVAGNAGPGIYSLPQYDMESRQLLEKGFQLDLFLNPIMKTNTTWPTAMVGGSLMFMKRSLWEELGGFPPYFESMAEDMLICCKARLAGYAVNCIDKSGYLHWVGRSFAGGKVKNNTLHFSPLRRRLSERNKTFVMIISYPLPALLLLMPLHVGFLLMEGIIIATLKGNFSIFRDIYLNAYTSVFSNWGALMADRRQVQRSRKISMGAFFRPFSLLPHKLSLLLKYGIPRNL